MENKTIAVEVAFALPDKQSLIALEVPLGTTAQQVVKLSKIQQEYPEETIVDADLGVFGKSVKPDYAVKAGDRVEVYRPLIADPKEVRKRRAEEAKARREQEKNK